jgi:hypothetical protein
MAPQLAMVLPALSSLGYKPRAEVCRTLVAQVGRLLAGMVEPGQSSSSSHLHHNHFLPAAASRITEDAASAAT